MSQCASNSSCPCLIHCQTWNLLISAVAESSMFPSRTKVPWPIIQDAMNKIPTLIFLTRPCKVTFPLGIDKRSLSVYLSWTNLCFCLNNGWRHWRNFKSYIKNPSTPRLISRDFESRIFCSSWPVWCKEAAMPPVANAPWLWQVSITFSQRTNFQCFIKIKFLLF